MKIWPTPETAHLSKACDELKLALDMGSMGAIVGSHTNLIGQYYKDVQVQAMNSFKAALYIAIVGFVVLAVGLISAVVMEIGGSASQSL